MQLNAANERLKLRGARQLGEHSIDQILAALNRFEEYTRRKAFRDFRIEQASGFKKHLASAMPSLGRPGRCRSLARADQGDGGGYADDPN